MQYLRWGYRFIIIVILSFFCVPIASAESGPLCIRYQRSGDKIYNSSYTGKVVVMWDSTNSFTYARSEQPNEYMVMYRVYGDSGELIKEDKAKLYDTVSMTGTISLVEFFSQELGTCVPPSPQTQFIITGVIIALFVLFVLLFLGRQMYSSSPYS